MALLPFERGEVRQRRLLVGDALAQAKTAPQLHCGIWRNQRFFRRTNDQGAPQGERDMRFDRRAFFVFLAALSLEVIIAVCFRTGFIRQFFGDVFVVVLICYLIRSLFDFGLGKTVLGTLLFAYVVEVGQFLGLIDMLGWRDSPAAQLAIGSTFDWLDMVAYTLGAGLCLAIACVGQRASSCRKASMFLPPDLD